MRLLLFVLFLLIPFLVGATDVARYQNPAADVSAVITDEPCPKKILDMLQGDPEDMAALRLVRVTAGGEHFDGCVMPPDADGDYAIFDERKHEGWLTARNVKPLI